MRSAMVARVVVRRRMGATEVEVVQPIDRHEVDVRMRHLELNDGQADARCLGHLLNRSREWLGERQHARQERLR
jgi:hypothetical protein